MTARRGSRGGAPACAAETGAPDMWNPRTTEKWNLPNQVRAVPRVRELHRRRGALPARAHRGGHGLGNDRPERAASGRGRRGRVPARGRPRPDRGQRLPRAVGAHTGAPRVVPQVRPGGDHRRRRADGRRELAAPACCAAGAGRPVRPASPPGTGPTRANRCPGSRGSRPGSSRVATTGRCTSPRPPGRRNREGSRRWGARMCFGSHSAGYPRQWVGTSRQGRRKSVMWNFRPEFNWFMHLFRDLFGWLS